MAIGQVLGAMGNLAKGVGGAAGGAAQIGSNLQGTLGSSSASSYDRGISTSTSNSTSWDQSQSSSYGYSNSDAWSKADAWSKSNSYGEGVAGSESWNNSRTYGQAASAEDIQRAAEANAVQNDMWTKQAEYNAAEAQKARDFEAMMSNTAYQRAVADLLAAGLNPILAAGNMGASTPVGAMASSGLAVANKAQTFPESVSSGGSTSFENWFNTAKSASESKERSESKSRSENKSQSSSSGGSKSESKSKTLNNQSSKSESTTTNNIAETYKALAEGLKKLTGKK